MSIRCNSCQRDLPEEQFYRRQDRTVFPCKECKRIYYRRWKALKPDYHKQWRAKNPEKDAVYNKRYRTKRSQPNLVLEESNVRFKT